MTAQNKLHRHDPSLLVRSLVATISVYLLTAIHHAYGAWLYKTPWRMHIVYHGLIMLLITGTFLFLYEWRKHKALLFLYLLLSGLFFGAFIGLFEGLYNHLLKNILFFAGLREAAMRWFFPASLYELPNDLLFEVTGIAQTFIGVIQLYYTVKLWKGLSLRLPPVSLFREADRCVK